MTLPIVDPERPDGYRLIVPRGWAQLPLDPVTSRQAIRRLAGERLAATAAAHGQSKDSITPARIALEQELGRIVDGAARGGAIDLYVLAEEQHGQPVSACLVVMHVPTPDLVPGRPEAEMLAARLGTDADEVGTVLITGRPAVRMRRHEQQTITTENGQETTISAVVVEYVVPVPFSPDHLIFAFSTPTLPVADAFVMLFDAVAASLRWRWPGALAPASPRRRP